MKTISFVLPVYNVKDYLEECVESIIKQSNEDIEIILVDDGSTDGSGIICDKISEKHKNVDTYHKTNGGLASARNFGIKKARGKYIAFIDSDDKIYDGCICKIIEYFNQYDIDVLFLNMDKFYPDGSIISMGDNINREEIIINDDVKIAKYLSTRPKFPGSVCSKIYNLEFLKKNNLEFPKDNRVSEDLGFTFECLMICNKMDKLDIPYYLYRQNRIGSITNSENYKSFIGLSKFIIETTDKYTTNKKNINEKSKYLLSYVAYEYAIVLRMYERINDPCEKKSILQFLKKYKWVMNYSNEKKLKVIHYLINILGLKCTSKIVYLIKNHKK